MITSVPTGCCILVIVEQCPGCGFDMKNVARTEYDEAAALAAGDRIAALVGDVEAELLAGDEAGLRTRPEPSTWSRLEYGCHIRDVLLVQRERVLLARRETKPELTAMGRDERVEHDGYAAQSPVDVGRQVVDAGRLFAGVLAKLAPADWDRTVVYVWPDRAERSLRWVAMHTWHEVVHHLDDMRRQAVG